MDRVRAYAIACIEQAKLARDELDACVDRLVVARDEAEASLDRCNAACEYAERLSVFAARAMAGDVEEDDLFCVAAAIEEIVGPVELSEGSPT